MRFCVWSGIIRREQITALHHVPSKNKLVVGVEFVQADFACWYLPAQWENSYGESDEEYEEQSGD